MAKNKKVNQEKDFFEEDEAQSTNNKDVNNTEEETEEEQPEIKPKKKMSLDSISGSLKKIKKLVDATKEKDSITAADKLNLRMAQMLLEYLSSTVDNILENFTVEG